MLRNLQGGGRSHLLRSLLAPPLVSQSARGGGSLGCRGLATATETIPADAASSPESERRAKWRWVLLFPAAFAAFLGCWQVSRYSWKVDLIDRRKAGLKEAPVDILSLPHAPTEYTRVAANGEFQHDKSAYIGPRPRTVMGTANAGFTLITPLVAKDWNKAVLVSRGWVPAGWKSDPAVRARNSPKGEVAVDGIVRASEARSGFVPDNNPDKGEWYWIDVPKIATACGLPPETPLIEVYSDEVPGDERGPIPTSMDALAFKARKPKSAALYPIPKSSADLLNVSVTPVDHRNYAITWFTLSGATAFLAARALRKPIKSPRK